MNYQKQIIHNVSTNTNIEPHKVKATLNHVCHWIKHTIMDCKYDQIRWTKLGTFTRLDVRGIKINKSNISEENGKSITSKITQCEESNE